jgi:hypothetical protein
VLLILVLPLAILHSVCSGLTSILSAPAISENMQQMPQPSAMPMQQMQNMQQMPQASASPMQMPSQRFMNAGGKVGYYQQGTGSATVGGIDLTKLSSDQLISLEQAGRITNEQRMAEQNRRVARSGDPRIAAALKEQERVLKLPPKVDERVGDLALPLYYDPTLNVPSAERRDAGLPIGTPPVARPTPPATPPATTTPAPTSAPAGTSAPAPAPTSPPTSERLGDYRIEIPKLLQKIEVERKNITNNMAALSELNKNKQIKRDEFLGARQKLDQQNIDLINQRKDLINTRMNQSPEHQAFKERLAKLTDEKTRQDELKSDFDKQAFLDLARFGFGVASNVDWASEAGKAIENFAETKKEERAAKRDLSKEVTNAMALELDLSDKERTRIEGLQNELLNADEKALSIATANIDTIRQLDKEAADDFITELATKNDTSKQAIDQYIDLIDNLGDVYEGIATAQAEGADYEPVPDSVLEDIANSSGIAALKGYESADFKNAFRDEVEAYLKRVGAGKGQATTIAARLGQNEEFMQRVRKKMERYRAGRTGGQQGTPQGSGGEDAGSSVTGESTQQILKSIREPQQ